MANDFVTVHFHIPTKFKRDGSVQSSTWLRALCIPVASLDHFSSCHYKWIRYLCYCLTGVKGSLSTSKTSTNWLDNSTARITTGTNLYFHLLNHDGFYLLDTGTASTSTHSDSSQKAGGFRDKLLKRDNNHCVVTNSRRTANLWGAHLLAYAKGNEYIQAFTEGRQCAQVIPDINDIRNGILVNSAVHALMGKQMAILPIPNFALQKSDIVINDRTENTEHKVQAADGCQWIVHDFIPGHPDLNIPHGSPIFIPTRLTKSNWPPEELFSAVYGRTASCHWVQDSFSSRIRQVYRSRNSQQQRKRNRDQSRAREERATKRQRRVREDDQEQNAAETDDPFELLMQLYTLCGGLRRPEGRDSNARVESWLDGVATYSSRTSP